MAAKKTRTTLTIDPGILKRATRAAKVQRISRSAWIEEAMRSHLEDQELMVKALSNPMLRDAFSQVFGKPEVIRQMIREMGQDLDDDQLDLFRQAFEKAVQ